MAYDDLTVYDEHGDGSPYNLLFSYMEIIYGLHDSFAAAASFYLHFFYCHIFLHLAYLFFTEFMVLIIYMMFLYGVLRRLGIDMICFEDTKRNMANMQAFQPSCSLLL